MNEKLARFCAQAGMALPDADLPLGCVIMASGLGKRFGGNKLLADFCGAPLIERALAATDGIFSRRVVVTRHREVERLCREKGIEVVLHSLPLRSDTVRLGMEALGDGLQGVLFCPGDQPLLRWETVAALALQAQREPAYIWRTVYEGTPGSPVLFPRWAFPELMALPEGKGGGFLAKKYPEQVRTVPVRDPYELRDADTPADLAELLAHQPSCEADGLLP
jgi:molybdenum cofactor cytidylyltransferase